jgi:type IV pilus assembly protein PilZ
MSSTETLSYAIRDPIELNLSYMPFIKEGGLFVPTPQTFLLGDKVSVDLQLPGKKDTIGIEGKVIWITPKNALHHVLPGIGIQFIGTNAPLIRVQLEANLDKSMEVGGYTYGMTGETKR